MQTRVHFGKSYDHVKKILTEDMKKLDLAPEDFDDAVMVASAKFPLREFYKVEEEKKAVPKLKDMNMDMRTKK